MGSEMCIRDSFIPDRCSFHLGGSLFNIRRLTAETNVSHDRVFKLQYADDAALPAHSATTLQGSLDVLSSAYNRAGLNVNAKKTEVLSLTTNRDSHAAPFSVHGNQLVEAREFTYLGNILSDDCSLNSEIEHRIKAAFSAFGRLLHRVFVSQSCHPHQGGCLQGCLCFGVALWLRSMGPLPTTHQGP